MVQLEACSYRYMATIIRLVLELTRLLRTSSIDERRNAVLNFISYSYDIMIVVLQLKVIVIATINSDVLAGRLAGNSLGE